MAGDVWMDRIKLAIKSLFLLAATLIVIVIASFIWAISYPDKAFQLAQRYFLPSDLTVKWEEMKFEAKRESWLRWDINWSAKNLRVEKVKPKLVLPVDESALRFAVRLFEAGPWFAFAKSKRSLVRRRPLLRRVSPQAKNRVKALLSRCKITSAICE